ncbi:MAG: citrate lyase subunit alpha [Candidatus Riflebacteria bacterium]|nr:citrate lyase subunit alpha [Candidatus Riflebacteria bacterium]
MNFINNTLGRKIPDEVNGRAVKPFRGAFADEGGGRIATRKISTVRHKGRINKVVGGWNELFTHLQPHSGMTISFHHHFRNGDYMINEVINRLAALGLKDLVIAPSALFPVHDQLVDLIKSGVISHVEGSMNGQVGVACSKGFMKRTAILRSHGGRARAIQDGDLHIDIAFIVAPTADELGNANGVNGPSACGPLGYALADSQFADQVVVITDNLVPYPCVPWSIMGGNVDYVLKVDKVGDPEKIVSGTTRLTKSPTQLMIAELAAKFVDAAGFVKDGFSFQAGAGGISLAFTVFLGNIMREKKVKASFVHGGSTEILVNLLNENLIDYILDLQAFDLPAVRSLKDNKRHIESPPFSSYLQHAKGCLANMLDVGVLGATEIDIDFNANVNTHSDGMLLHGTGGFSDVAAGSGCTILTAPSFRKRIPIIKERVTTITAPGEVVDVLVTERGICINPRRSDILDRVKNSGLPIIPIRELMDKVHTLTGIPEKPKLGDRPVALIEWRDGTVIDSVWQVLED